MTNCSKRVVCESRSEAVRSGFRIGDKVFAIENECPHRGGPLHEGLLEGLEVVCPWHAWTFHLGTGQCTFVEGVAVATYPVRVENGRILVSPIACEATEKSFVVGTRSSPDSKSRPRPC